SSSGTKGSSSSPRWMAVGAAAYRVITVNGTAGAGPHPWRCGRRLPFVTMHLRRDRVETTIRLLAAGAGTVLAHTVDYAALFPDRGARSRVLAATGHGYWHLAVLAAMAAGLAAAALVVARGASNAMHHEPEPHGNGFRLLDVVVMQVGVFAGIELLERVSAGLSPAVLFHERAFRLGIGLQVVVGVVVAVALMVLHRA